MLNSFVVLIAVLLVVGVQYSRAYDNGMAAEPIRGWSTWCTNDLCGLRDKCSEFEVRKRADALISEGLFDLGYKWILLDDCWSDHSRDSNGELQPNPHQFPSGIPALTQYLHERGLKLGIYTCIGTETCKKNRPGSYGHYEQDAQTLARWEVDMVKTDYCHKPGNETGRDLYTQFSKALNATGRPMLFSLCQWGEDDVWDWAPEISQMYRIQMDHIPFFNWPATANGAGYGCGTHQIIDWMADLHPSQYVRPNAWMDPDFLETLFDPITMNFIDSRTEFSFWSLWSAPLMVSTDVVDLTDNKRVILTNTEVLAIQNDPLYVAGERIFKNSVEGQAWFRPLSNGDIVVILYNGNNKASMPIRVQFADFSHPNGKKYGLTTTLKGRDLWKHEDLGSFTGGFTSDSLEPHDIQMVRFSWV